MTRWQRRPAVDPDQLPLAFGGVPAPAPPVPIIAPCPGKAATSREAAQRVRPSRAESDRRRILHYVVSRGAEGATRDDIVRVLGIEIQTVCPRVDELLTLAHLEQTKERRHTRSGASAFILVATAAGRAADSLALQSSPPDGSV